MKNTVSKILPMVDLVSQYQAIKPEVDTAIQSLCAKGHYIGGDAVVSFEKKLGRYLDIDHVIACANGTDALQIALMALDLQPGDAVMVPSFTFIASAEVIALLSLTPIMVDVDPATFNMCINDLYAKYNDKVKVIMPVHLFGQSCDMDAIIDFAEAHELYVVEDNAQAIGGSYTFGNGRKVSNGTSGHIGTTSFFPAKNLGCYGDGGALFTNDEDLADRIRTISNHGMKKRYHHDMIGCNSRLDAIQAAVLNIKLHHLDDYVLMHGHWIIYGRRYS